MSNAVNYIYIFLTIFFTVYGQLIIKWQVSKAGNLPLDLTGKVWFILHLLSNPWVISGFIGAFLASLAWMAVLTKFEISYAYPYTSLSFVLVLILSTVFFNEAFTLTKTIGLTLVVLGIIVGSK